MGIGLKEMEEAAALAVAFSGCRSLMLWNELKKELLSWWASWPEVVDCRPRCEWLPQVSFSLSFSIAQASGRGYPPCKLL